MLINNNNNNNNSSSNNNNNNNNNNNRKKKKKNSPNVHKDEANKNIQQYLVLSMTAEHLPCKYTQIIRER